MTTRKTDSFSAQHNILQEYEKNIELYNSEVKEYLDFMGYAEETIKTFHLGYVPFKYKDNPFSGRLIYPWLDRVGGFLLGICGRYINHEEKGVFQKFIVSDELKKVMDYELYGIHQAENAIKQEDCVYVVNGYTDVFSWYQKGLRNVVSCSGRPLTVPQVRLIHYLTNNVTLICEITSENDCCAVSQSRDVLIQQGFNVDVVALPDYDDAESFSRGRSLEEMKDYLKSNVMTPQELRDVHI